jgi:hypothetical protein
MNSKFVRKTVAPTKVDARSQEIGGTEDLFQGQTRFVGTILQTNLSLCSVRCLLFADFRFRAAQIPRVVLNSAARNSNPGHHQQSISGRKHVSQSGRKKIGDRTIQNFLRKRRVRPERGVRVVAMRAYQCCDLHEAEVSKNAESGKLKS